MLKTLTSRTKAMVLADQAVFSGNNFIVTLLLARILSSQDFGVYSAVILSIYLGVSIVNAIVIQPIQVNWAKEGAKKEYDSFTLWLQFIVVILITLTVSFLSELNIQAIQNYHFSGIPLLAGGVLMHDYFRKLFLVKSEMKHALLIDLTVFALQFSFIGYCWYSSQELSYVMIGLGYTYLPSVFIGLVILAPINLSKRLIRKYLRMHYDQGKWLLLTALVQWWSGNLFVVASGLFLGVEALGAFRLVQSLFGVLNIIFQTFENYIIPQASLRLTESFDEAKKYIRKVNLQVLLLFGILLFITFIFSYDLITLAGGAKYEEYGFVIRGMACLYLIILFGYPVRMSMRVLLLNRYIFMGYLLSLAFGLTASKFLLENFHLSGAIAGLAISQVILILFWSIILNKRNFLIWK